MQSTTADAARSALPQPISVPRLPPQQLPSSSLSTAVSRRSGVGGPSSSFTSPTVPPSSHTAAAALNRPASGTGSASNTTAPLAAGRNTATQRKVAKLLEITASNEMKGLASYVDDILPGYFYNADPSDAVSTSSNSGSRAPTNTTATATTSTTVAAGKPITSAALRSALDTRSIELHKAFLRDFAIVYEDFQRTVVQVAELDGKCTDLEAALTNSAAAGSASSTDDFFYQIQIHQAELQLVQQHAKEVDEFRQQHHFGSTEQRALEEGPIDMTFLTVLEQARAVHHRSSELMQSQDYHQGAAAVMEATATAIARAMERVARHLLATAGSNDINSDAHGSSLSSPVPGRGAGAGAGSIAADTPEVTGFQLRCVRLLYEESPSLHARFVDEVARLRRSSVLRRYFHLLTTGSTTTASSVYHTGGRAGADSGAGSAVGMGARPLEAELNNPTYFFGSLCAWLHQTIVEEQDFLYHFFISDEDEAHVRSRGPTVFSAQAAEDAVSHDRDLQRALLDVVFGGVCKHIRAALDNVLERLGRSAATLGTAAVAVVPSHEASPSASGSLNESKGGESQTDTREVDDAAPRKGPRGLTGGLTRLFMAATGRAPTATLRHFTGGAVDGDDTSAIWQRYATVSTRSQQEAVVAGLLHPPLQGLTTCVTLVLLFEYYSATTFVPLLGATAELTSLVQESAPRLTRAVFERLLRVLAVHLLDSTAGVIQRTAPLRRLASAHVSGAGNDAYAPPHASSTSGMSMSAGSGQQSKTSAASSYVLDFLFSLSYGEASEPALGASMSLSSVIPQKRSSLSFQEGKDSQLQRHSAQELKRVLSQLILPPPPEVMAYATVLHSVLRDTARQAELLEALSRQQQHHSHKPSQPETSSVLPSSSFHYRTAVADFVRELLEGLWTASRAVQEAGPVRASLDEPCLATLEYNILYQLREVLDTHHDTLALLGGGSHSDGSEEGGYAEAAARLEATRETLDGACSAAMNALRRRLLAFWEAAVAHHFFPIPAEPVVAVIAASASGSDEVDEQQTLAAKKDVRRVVAHLEIVYNTVAASGHLPEPVPLLLALCGGDSMRAEVSKAMTKCVVERVYPAQFNALLQLPSTPELRAVQEDMSPQNLASLMDFSAMNPNST